MKVTAVFRGTGGDRLSNELIKMLGMHPVYPFPQVVRFPVRLEYHDDHGLTPKVIALSGPLKGRDVAVVFGPVDIEIEC